MKIKNACDDCFNKEYCYEYITLGPQKQCDNKDGLYIQDADGNKIPIDAVIEMEDKT